MTRKKCKQCDEWLCYLLNPYTFEEKDNRFLLILYNNIDETLCCLCNRLKGKMRYYNCCYQCRSTISMGIIRNKHQVPDSLIFMGIQATQQKNESLFKEVREKLDWYLEKTTDDFCDVILSILIDGPLTSIEIRNRIPGDTWDINRAIKKLYRNGKINMIKQGRKYPYKISVPSPESTNYNQLSKQKERVMLE